MIDLKMLGIGGSMLLMASWGIDHKIQDNKIQDYKKEVRQLIMENGSLQNRLDFKNGQIVELEHEILKQNKRIKKIEADRDKKAKEFEEWKAKGRKNKVIEKILYREEVIYKTKYKTKTKIKYKTKIVKERIKSNDCKDIKAVLDGVNTVSYDQL